MSQSKGEMIRPSFTKLCTECQGIRLFDFRGGG